jgi:hypothetical protein
MPSQHFAQPDKPQLSAGQANLRSPVCWNKTFTGNFTANRSMQKCGVSCTLFTIRDLQLAIAAPPFTVHYHLPILHSVFFILNSEGHL